MDLTLPIAFAVGLVTSIIAGRLIIPVLRRMKAGQTIRADGPAWHSAKSGTPTMGGLIFIIGVTAAVIFPGIYQITENRDYGHLYVLLFALVFGAIGFADDYVKVKKRQNLGLTALQKLILQVVAAVAFVLLLRNTGFLTPNLYIPFFNVTTPLWEPLYLAFAAFVIVATVNAVNITDGVDGLATGVTIPIAAFFALAAGMWGYNSIGLFGAGLAGALVGFLVYNFNPAKVFMGDTGSLFLGGAVAGMAFALDMPLVIVPIGVIYIVEVLSDIIQIVYFKATKGGRIFKMAPLHHHLEMSGWSEKKLFWVFTLITAAMCVLAWFGIQYRYGA